jgi:hypothetical protein
VDIADFRLATKRYCEQQGLMTQTLIENLLTQVELKPDFAALFHSRDPETVKISLSRIKCNASDTQKLLDFIDMVYGSQESPVSSSKSSSPGRKRISRQKDHPPHGKGAAEQLAILEASRGILAQLGFATHPNDDPKLQGNRQSMIAARGPLMRAVAGFCHAIGVLDAKEIQALNMLIVAEEKRPSIIRQTGIKGERLDELFKMTHELLAGGYSIKE